MNCFDGGNPIWIYFLRAPHERVAKCNICKYDYSYKTSITNLKTHLRTKHPAQYQSYLIIAEQRRRHVVSQTNKEGEDFDDDEGSIEISDGNETYQISLNNIKQEEVEHNNLTESFTEATEPSTSEQQSASAKPTSQIKFVIKDFVTVQQNFINSKLLKMIVKTYQPLSIVEESDFVEFVEALNGDYKLPARKVISEVLIPVLYGKCLSKQKILLQDAESVCLTSELWTSTNNEAFMCISGHYINKDFQFKSTVLKCWHLSSKYSSIDLAIIFRSTCQDWGIFNKINICVTDNNKDMIEAVNSLGWDHCSCIAQKLNNILQSFTNIYESTLKKFNTIACRYRLHNKAEKGLDMDSSQLRVGDNEIPLECLNSMPLMWNAVYLMIERFLNLKEEIKAIDLTIIGAPNITDDEWTSLNQLYLTLKPFYQAITEFSSDKYIYASKAIALLNGLKDVMKALEKKSQFYSSSENILKKISTKLYEEFSSAEYEAKLAICTILDPRFKTSMFIDEILLDTVESAKANLVSAVHQLMKNESQNKIKNDLGNQSTMDVDDGEISLWRKRNLSIESRKRFSDYNHLVFAEHEVTSYLQDELAETNCDPCTWWQINELRFPHLAKLFKTKCNVVANSIPSEILFTKNGLALRDRRASLPLEKTEQLVFLNTNLSETDYDDLIPMPRVELFS